MDLTQNNRRLALVSVFLVANALIWYFLAASTLEDIINQTATNYAEKFLIWGLHFGTSILSLIAGTLLVKKIGRILLFTLWTLMGAFSPLVLLTLNFAPIPITLLVALLFGFSLGIGLPNCLQYFRSSTTMGNRGRYAGIIVLGSGLGTFILGMIDISLEATIVILMIFRLAGLIILRLPAATQVAMKVQPEKKTSFSFVKERSFFLYFIPWIMFSLVNYLSTPVQFSIVGESTMKTLIIIENVFVGVFAIAGGFLCDFIGRKRTAIIGFILLGLGFSFLGLFPFALESSYFHTVVDGTAWGLLYVLFVIVIWGELDNNAPSDKFYAVGVLPFFISKFLQLVMGGFVSTDISPYALFSFIAFFLFIAILPLVYAPETLPEKNMKDRELRRYIEKAKKIAQKEGEEEKISIQNSKASDEVQNHQEEENNKEYDRAKKLAEKYY